MKNTFTNSVPRGGAGLLVASFMVVLLPACGGDSKPEWPKGNVVFEPTHNYTSQTSLSIPQTETAPGADLMICWDALQKDLLCHNIVAPSNDIDNVSFLQIPNMTHDTAEAKLAIGQLDPNLVHVYGDFHVDHTAATKCVKLSELKLGDPVIPATDYTEDATRTYMLLFESGTTPGVGSRSMMFLVPTSSSTATTVNAVDACASSVLTFNATLGAPMTISATDRTKWHVDWSQLTVDSFGNPIDFRKIDKALVGFYQDKTAADLQAGFKDIEISATSLYEVAVSLGARDADLANAKLRGGTEMFPGFTRTNGTWALAVTCSKCQVPAPILMTILQPQ